MASTIMIIEDDIQIQKLLRLVLERGGYKVVSAFDGLEGLEKLDAAMPDLIVLDLMLPGMDGFQFAEELKQRELPQIPIIVLTACRFPSEYVDAMGASAVEHKPFDVKHLMEQVAQFAPPGLGC